MNQNGGNAVVQAVRVLQLEDEPADAELVENALRKAGIVFLSKRVDTRAGFVSALEEFRPDIVLADYRLPAFDGMRALTIAAERAPDVPFIFVSGAMCEESAIEALHLGAVDYVIKKRLSKLVPAVTRALQEVRERRLRRRAEVVHRESTRKLARALEDTIQAIATTIEAHDPYTAGHQQQVSRLAAAMAREMGLDDARVAGVKRGGEIHDIGKIYIPAEILNRPGQLSDIEFALVKTHPQVGYDIIKDINFPWPIAAMILQHHERLDGSGYPSGLKGDTILLEAKILAVADVVEAMMNHRPYRPALGLDAAIEEIGRSSGRLFDPAAVDACTRLLRNGSFLV